MIQNQIYNYFERNEDMHVLFTFDRMDYIGVELRDAEWKVGYGYVTFDGKWFTTKYNIHNEWKDDKVILLFPPDWRNLHLRSKKNAYMTLIIHKTQNKVKLPLSESAVNYWGNH